MIDFSGVKAIAIPEGVVTKIVSAGATLWQAVTYKNWVRHSTESGGASIYNGGLGYKNGYRIRSGGAEASLSTAVCTGFIPFEKGDVLRIYPAFTGQNSQNAVSFSDASYANLGQITASGSLYGICEYAEWKDIATNVVDGVTVIDISSTSNSDGIAYIRVTNDLSVVVDGSNMIITINEEIT